MRHELATEMVDVSKLKPYDRNPRIGDVEAIARSLEKNGQYRPIVVNRRDFTILAGNHTWKAAQRLGWEQVAVSFVDADEDLARRIVLVDNRSNDVASYDEHALVDLLNAVKEEEGVLGLVGTGFSEANLDELLLKLAGPAALDQLADEYDPTDGSEDNDGTKTVVLRLRYDIADAWSEHRADHDSDSEALAALL